MLPDPFPSIPPALLNAGDIRAYAEHPHIRLFSPFNERGLKPASYEIAFDGEVHYWEFLINENRNSERCVKQLTANDTFTIRPNSIVFVRPSTQFDIPAFLAGRFNLSIKRVHQGLLLGTGPLVDPGFKGRLLIPVHNLTSREITIRGKDGFIWVEVTKLSPIAHKWDGVLHPHSYAIPRFPATKLNLEVADYFDKANGGVPILSSVQQALDQGQALLRRMQRWSIVGAIGLAVSIVVGGGSMLIAAFQLYGVIQSAHGKLDGTTAELAKIREGDLKKLEADIAVLQTQFRQLQAKPTIATVPSVRSERP